MYNQQMEQLEQEQQSVAVVLSCLLDDIQYKGNPGESACLDDLTMKIQQKEDQSIRQILDSFSLDTPMLSTSDS